MRADNKSILRLDPVIVSEDDVDTHWNRVMNLQLVDPHAHDDPHAFIDSDTDDDDEWEDLVRAIAATEWVQN